MARRAAFLFSTVLSTVLLSGCVHLSLTQVAMPAESIAVRNQKDVLLFAFDLGGHQSNQSRLTTIVLRSANAPDDVRNATNYSLVADTDGDGTVDTVLQDKVSAVNNRITFDNLSNGGFVVNKDQSRRVEVRADISASLVSTTLQLTFANAVVGYVQGENADDGRDLVGVQIDNNCPVDECEISINSGTATKYTLKDSGDLYVTESSPSRSRQMLGGTTGDSALHLRLLAEYEDIDVKKLGFIVASENSTVPNSVSRLELYRVPATTPFATATIAGCDGGGGGGGGYPSGYKYTYCTQLSTNQLRISANASESIIVRPVINTDQNGGQSGTDFTVKISKNGELGMTIEANGAESFNALKQNDGDNVAEGEVIIGKSSAGQNADIVSPKHIVVMSKISSIENADLNADGTAIAAGTDRPIGQFKFKAAEQNNSRDGLNKVTINGLVFTLDSQNIEFDETQFKVYNKADATTKSSCNVVLTEGNTKHIQCGSFMTDSDPVMRSINPGADLTMVLEADVINAEVSSTQNSFMQVSLTNYSDAEQTVFGGGATSGWGANASHLMWMDGDFGTAERYVWTDFPEATVNSTRYGGGGGGSSSSSSAGVCTPACTGNELCIDGECVPQSGSGSISDAELHLIVKPQASDDAAVRNQNNVNFLRFEARASDAEDLLLTDLIFESATSASLTNANDYTLWVDSDGNGNVDTVLQSGQSNQSNTVVFDGLTGGGWVIPKDTTVVFEVHADIAASFTEANPVLALRFDTGSTFVSAEQLDDGTSLSGIQYTNLAGTTAVIAGGCTANSSCNIKVTTANATRYTLRNSGDLYVTNSNTSLRNRQLLGGTLEQPILRLQFRAEHEDIDVRDLVFTAYGANANSFSTNVQNLELFKAGETVPFANATVGGCATGTPNNSMCASMQNQQLIIPKGDDSMDILVRPRLNTDVNGATRGHIVQLYVDKTKTASDGSGTGAVRALGLQSSTYLAANDADSTAEGEVFIGSSSANAANTNIVGNVNHVVLSKVTSITDASLDADGTAFSSGDDRPIGQFKFAAASHGNSRDGSNDWHLYGIIFNVNATNVLLGTGDQRNPATSDFMLYNKADSSSKVPCTANAANASGASLLVTCTDLIDLPISSSIDAGSDTTFVLEADVVNAKISSTATSILQTSFTQYTNHETTTFGETASHVRWVDDDNGTDAVFHWIDYPETTINSTRYVN